MMREYTCLIEYASSPATSRGAGVDMYLTMVDMSRWRTLWSSLSVSMALHSVLIILPFSVATSGVMSSTTLAIVCSRVQGLFLLVSKLKTFNLYKHKRIRFLLAEEKLSQITKSSRSKLYVKRSRLYVNISHDHQCHCYRWLLNSRTYLPYHGLADWHCSMFTAKHMLIPLRLLKIFFCQNTGRSVISPLRYTFLPEEVSLVQRKEEKLVSNK